MEMAGTTRQGVISRAGDRAQAETLRPQLRVALPFLHVLRGVLLVSLSCMVIGVEQQLE